MYEVRYFMRDGKEYTAMQTDDVATAVRKATDIFLRNTVNAVWVYAVETDEAVCEFYANSTWVA